MQASASIIVPSVNLLLIIAFVIGNGSTQPTADEHSCCETYCATQDEDPYLMMATKTAYQIIFGKRSDQQIIPDCVPIQFWSLNRHGTSYPNAQKIDRLRALNRVRDRIVDNYENQRSYPDQGRLCTTDYNLLKNWRWNETIDESRASGLTYQGNIDVKYLARRYYSRFEALFREPYNEHTYNFQHTGVDRTHDSFLAFTEGLFRWQAAQVHANIFNDNNRFIKPTEWCNHWKAKIDENDQTLAEQRRFIDSVEYQKMVLDVYRRLGFAYTPNETLINDMYDACRLEKAWNLDGYSPWCYVFTKSQLKLLEYAQDLKYYYRSGYGNREDSEKIACPLVRDLYDKFSLATNGSGLSAPKVSAIFTHSVTIQTFLTAMGFNRDMEPLTADNYQRQGQRQWRTSKMSPFAANLVAVLYRCRERQGRAVVDQYQVLFFLNEVPVDYPRCKVGLCAWTDVVQRLRPVADACDLEEYCARGGATAVLHSHDPVPSRTLFIASLTMCLTVIGRLIHPVY